MQALCNSGVRPRFIKHVLSWLQCNREKVALDPPEEKAEQEEAPAWPSQNWMSGTENCSSRQNWSRNLQGGHTVRLAEPQRHAQHDAIRFHYTGTREVTQVHRVVTNRCNPSKCRVKHSHIHLRKWKKETALSYKQWQNPQPQCCYHLFCNFSAAASHHMQCKLHCNMASTFHNDLSNSATLK